MCAMRRNGSITKSFSSKEALVKWVALTYGRRWDDELMVNEEGPSTSRGVPQLQLPSPPLSHPTPPPPSVPSPPPHTPTPLSSYSIIFERVHSSAEVLSTDEESSDSGGESDDELGRNLESLLSSKKTAMELTHEQEETE